MLVVTLACWSHALCIYTKQQCKQQDGQTARQPGVEICPTLLTNNISLLRRQPAITEWTQSSILQLVLCKMVQFCVLIYYFPLNATWKSNIACTVILHVYSFLFYIICYVKNWREVIFKVIVGPASLGRRHRRQKQRQYSS